MELQTDHALLSKPTVDELGRESFLAGMRQFLITELYNGNEIAFKKRQVPEFTARDLFGSKIGHGDGPVLPGFFAPQPRDPGIIVGQRG
jgi:hypothetical protein